MLNANVIIVFELVCGNGKLVSFAFLFFRIFLMGLKFVLDSLNVVFTVGTWNSD
jgi:hypothetical protein